MVNIFKDKDGRVVIGQRPNKPIILAFIFWVIAYVFNNGLLHIVSYSIFLIILSWWAYLEITQGVNYFRRLLGFIVLVFIVYKAANIIV